MNALILVLALQDPEQQLAEALRSFESARQDIVITRAAFEQLRGLPPEVLRSTDDRLGELLFAIGDDEASRMLGEHIRASHDREDQLREIDYLARIDTPASRAALLAVASEEALDAEVRLAAAERLRAGGADPKKVLSALAHIRTDSSSVSPVEPAPEPKAPAVRTAPAAREPRPGPVEDGAVARARLNVILASVAVALAILLLATRRRA